jgi:hypothetical protein
MTFVKVTQEQLDIEARAESLDPLLFRLKAIDGGSSLDIYVLKESGETAAHFNLKDINGDFGVGAAAFVGSDVWVESSARNFTAQEVLSKLTMVVPAAGAEYETPLLGDTRDNLRVVSTAQSVDPAPDLPSFIERFDSGYLMRSRGTTEPVTINVSSPGRAVVPRMSEVAIKAAVTPAATAQGTGKAVPTPTTAVHPWLSARAILSPYLDAAAARQAGTSLSTAKAALIHPDLFFSSQDTPVAGVRPSVQVAFQTAFHPFMGELTRRLEVDGVDSLLSLDSQALGNPYLRSPWSGGYVLSTNAAGAISIIEGGMGRDPVSGQPGNLEGVVLEGERLVHYWHNSADIASPWQAALTVTEKATGQGVLTERVSTRVLDPQGRVQARGTFDVTVLQAEGLTHWFWPNSQPAQWQQNANPIVTANAVGPASQIESDYLTDGKRSVEVLVPEKTADPTKWQLARYRLDNADNVWKPVDIVSRDVAGGACFMQSSFVTQGHGRLEALVLQRNVLAPGGNQLVHFWKDETVADWQMGVVVSESASAPGSLIESRVRDCQFHGNFEALVVEGTQLVHYWRDNSVPAQPWQRGQVISTAASGSGCIIESHFGAVGNFEVVVPEGNRAQHYWHSNEGPVGSPGERFYFSSYVPTPNVDDPYPRHDIAFALSEPYSLYNWELFFHLPMLVATRLMRNQRFSDARRWFHRVFNPTDGSNELSAQRAWQFLPLRADDKLGFEQGLLALHSSTPQDGALAADLRNQISDWIAHPFMPHRIARARIGAYKKNVVMKYVDNLIAEGDHLFRLDSVEAINTATQRFVMAKNIMGPRPERVPPRTDIPSKTYSDLRKAGIDDFGDAVVQLENEFPFAGDMPPSEAAATAGILGMTSSLYFRIPQNEKLLAYWDTIDDRLFKIRHSMNIEGAVRQLPLFEPPIDPMMLVEAAAQGMSLSSALASMNAPLPFYRFAHTLQKALELAGEVRAIGAEMLAVLEKKDGEALARLRSSQETVLLTLMRIAKEQQQREAELVKDGLLASRDTAVTRWLHYQQLLGQTNAAPALPTMQSSLTNGEYKIVPTVIPAATYTSSSRFELVDMGSIGIGASLGVGDLSVSASVSEDDNPGTKILSYEKQELVQSFNATTASVAAAVLEGLGGVLGMVPTFGANLEPLGAGVTISFGGANLAGGTAAAARAASLGSTIAAHGASRAGKMAAFVLREREWGLQNDLAAKEIFQIDQQIVAAQVRMDLAQRELDGHDQQIANAQAVEVFLQSKFTSIDLYSWMLGELVKLYSAVFDLAFDVAKKAELCYRFELGVTDSSFIQPVGYWDGVHSGLLAGERLSVALRQLERAYEDQNQREYELTTHVSVLQIDPLQLIRLKETGVCEFEVTEGRLDFDHPGQYFRRIKSVSVTIPCVVGPYVGVSCTLRLQGSAIRFQTSAGTQYPRVDDSDPRFVVSHAATQAIATSSTQNDSGMFEVNFRDERYLPFEGAGAISTWRLELNGALPQFDHQTIADVVLHLRYTAREGGERVKAAAIAAFTGSLKSGAGPMPLHGSQGTPTPPARLFSVRHEFPNEWQKLMRPPAESEVDAVLRSVELPIVKARFPFHLAVATVQPQSAFLVAVPKLGGQLAGFSVMLKTSQGDPAAINISLQPNPQFGQCVAGGTSAGTSLAKIEADPAKTWSLGLSMDRSSMQSLSESVQDLFLVVAYAATVSA